jgi:tripartite-type tricarboxylate transporter receptor subunit TctC
MSRPAGSDVAITTPGTLASHRAEMKALVQSTETRSPFAPDVPTSIEAGVPGFQFESWTARVVKKGTSEALVNHMTQMLTEVSQDPEYLKRFKTMDVQPLFIAAPNYRENDLHQIAARRATLAALTSPN